jgi:thiamine biosynthesis lipoprotein
MMHLISSFIARCRLPLGLALLLLCAVPCRGDWVTGEEAIMGTAIRVELWEPKPGQGPSLIAAVMDEMRRVDRRMSTYKETSVVSDINRRAAVETVALDDELYELIDRALTFSRLTNGAFDITYASVGRLYDYRNAVRPDAAARDTALKAVDYRNVLLDSPTRAIRFRRAGVQIDLGGIAKGYAVENAAAILKRRGVTSAIVTAGGDSRIVGDRRGRPWTVGIRDPRDREGLVTRIPLQDEAISTSGDYERFFESDGVRFHHIIKPTTGMSASNVRSVTVIGGDATMTDALSTGVFVLGRVDGLALIETMENFEAVIIDSDGAMHYSSGLVPGG